MDFMPWNDRIGRRLKLKDLQTLMAVIDAGGVGKAADRLNYSQPAVSKAIASLERALGSGCLSAGGEESSLRHMVMRYSSVEPPSSMTCAKALPIWISCRTRLRERFESVA